MGADAGSSPTLSFLGATGTVTGSRFLVDTGQARVLVDCGMYQGLKPLRERNREPFAVDPSSIDAVVLTHAHLDHSGYLPALVRDGFGGDVVCSPPSAALAAIVMADAGRLQEEEADYANAHGFSKHRPAVPLFTEEDASLAATRFHPVPFGTRHRVAEGVELVLSPAGHIPGSSTATLALWSPDGGTRTLMFSGDLGRPNHPILRPPAPAPAADVMVLESTYGNRSHGGEPVAEERLAEVINRTAAHGGTVVIPSFAVDRTEVILMALRRLMAAGRIPSLPVYADSPMALDVLRVYRRAIADGDAEIRPETLAEGGAGADAPDPFDPGTLVELRTPEESRSLNDVEFPSVIISASGMATGGRVLHHLLRLLPDNRNTVVLPGFQSEGTRGRLLADGAKAVKMLGRYVPVRADVVVLDAFSAHADADEMVAWLRGAPRAPDAAYVVHGEPDAAAALAARLGGDLGWHAVVPRYGERVRVD